MKLRKIILLGLAAPAAAFALAGMVAVAGLQIAIRRVPDNTFTREGIQKILSRESVVLYSDGKTRVGTFFEGTHRDYLPFDSIPRVLVDALVAAEDRNYWNHGGWDVKAFARAMADNVTSGGKWRGGSTLTQQTAKNLFGRTGPLRGKVDELINAYRLERNFSKEEILEFYLNQFFVTGNGHGVSIAARYFFDKEPRDLNLVECAFIAGSVKGPNQYNPFIQSTPERRKFAIDRGRTRTAYVLKQLRRTGKISEKQYQDGIAHPPRLKRGDFRFTLSTNMMKVKRLLDSPEMQALLARYGVEDYTGAGLQIYTTLDPQIQRAAERALYSNLAGLDLVLRGYVPTADSAPDRLSHLEPGTFVTGRITEVTRDNGAVTAVHLRFGAIEGNIPKTSLDAFFRLWNRNKTGSDALPTPAAMSAFAAQNFQVGGLLYCGVPLLTPEEIKRGAKAAYRLEIAQHPQLQGAAQVVQEGKVLANVGGFENTGYDRVNQARRQFGSAFKPLVYAAALEQGWHALDPLSNQRQAFQLGNLIYFPKPDHAPEDTVSLAWAGRRSENIASVWLLYHLFDKTDFEGFWNACRNLGLDPDNFASPESYEMFVRDTLGIVLDADHLRELRYRKAATDLAVDLTFDGRAREAAVLRELPYGLGYARESERLPSGSSDPETRIRREILARNYLAHVALAVAWRRGEGAASGQWIAARSENDNRLGLFMTLPARGWRAVSLDEARREGPARIFFGGDLSLETLRTLEDRLRPAEPPGERYTRENLYASKDFRAQAALRHVTEFSRKLGVNSPLDGVLSFPLGVNVITLGEAVNAYQVFQEGARHRTRFGQSQLYIERIQTPDGRVIFEDYPEREEMLSEGGRFQLEAVLASVVQGGTGQRIGKELRVNLGNPPVTVVVPAYGKTGTTNDYRNAAFLGYIAAPKGQGKGFDPLAGYTIGVYTGFDDNRPMSRAGFRGTGAAAAVPAWLAIAQQITRIQNFVGRVEAPDPESWNADETPLFQREQYKLHKVSRRTGLPLDTPENSDYVEDLSDELSPTELAQPSRDYAPLWIREE